MRELKPNIPILGLEDYHITKRGNLYSNKSGKWKLVKGCINSKWGRKQYRFNIAGKRKWLKSSRLVALVYVTNPNPDKYNVVCHKDNNPLNDYYKNLYWGDYFMNNQQTVRDGRHKVTPRYGKDNPAYGKTLSDSTKKKISTANSGKNNGNFKCDEKLVKKIFNLRKLGYGQSKIAKELVISSHTVNKTLRGHNILGLISDEYLTNKKDRIYDISKSSHNTTCVGND